MGKDTQAGDISPLDSHRMGGLLLVDKPGGVTSHDVVAAVRKHVRPLKVGHTGTLDPLATGLLVLCIGEATKIAGHFQPQTKAYRTTALLGIVTDTQDITGEVIVEKDVGELSEDCIEGICRNFVGDIQQTPPAFSAIKVDGVRSYKRARRKEEFQLEPRGIKITRLEVERVHLPRVDFLVECSKGTYIRTLCHDIGAFLGVGACMESLHRIGVGRFDIANAKSLENLDTREKIFQALVPASEALPHMSPVKCDPGQIEKLSHGMALEFAGSLRPGIEIWAKALGPDGELFAIGKIRQDGDKLVFRPKRVLVATWN